MNRKQTARFADLEAAAAFYGLSARGFMGFKAAGEDAGDLLPFDDPPAMPGWFERRGRKVPALVLARAVEEGKPSKSGKNGTKVDKSGTKEPAKPASGVKNERKRAPGASWAAAGLIDGAAVRPAKPAPSRPEKPAKDPGKPSVRLEMGEGATLEGMIADRQQLYAALQVRLVELFEVGDYGTAEATQIMGRQEKLMASILSLTKARVHGREDGEWVRLSEVRAAAAAFASGVARLFRRELPGCFPPADHERILAGLDRLAEKLPGLMPAEFGV